MPQTPVAYKKPHALSLSRIRDRLTFLYLDKCAIRQDDNGTLATIHTGTDNERTAYLPTATLACLLLGPGTSLTQAAAAALARTGCATIFVGSGAVRSYTTFTPLASTTRLLDQQARIVTDTTLRTAAARRMYLKRFPGALPHQDTTLTIDQLRGMEGVRMRAFYQAEAQKRRLPHWQRNRGNQTTLGPMDTVNTALNYANTALYGVTHAAVTALGLSPGLGIIHHGNQNSFVLDIADLYKTDITIPLAFSLHNSTDPGRDATIALRDKLTLIRILPRIVDDIHDILDLDRHHDDDPEWDINDLFLWSPETTTPSGNNHAALPFLGTT